METFKQFERRIKKLEKRTIELTDIAMSGNDGLASVMQEIGKFDIKVGSKAEVMQSIADRVIAPHGVRYLAVEGPLLGMVLLIPISPMMVHSNGIKNGA